MIEWAERLDGDLPPDRVDVVIEPGSKSDARTATLRGRGAWKDRPIEF